MNLSQRARDYLSLPGMQFLERNKGGPDEVRRLLGECGLPCFDCICEYEEFLGGWRLDGLELGFVALARSALVEGRTAVLSMKRGEETLIAIGQSWAVTLLVDQWGRVHEHHPEGSTEPSLVSESLYGHLEAQAEWHFANGFPACVAFAGAVGALLAAVLELEQAEKASDGVFSCWAGARASVLEFPDIHTKGAPRTTQLFGTPDGAFVGAVASARREGVRLLWARPPSLAAPPPAFKPG